MVLQPENDDFLAKIEFGFRLAARRLYQQRAEKNETVVICEDGVIKHVPAKQILAEQNTPQMEQYFKEGSAKYLIHR